MSLWKVDTEEPTDQPEKMTAFKVSRGHSGSVQSGAPQTSGSMICSSSLECRINLWKTYEPDTVSIKIRKVKKKDTQVLSDGEAVSSLLGHTQQVSSVVWPEHSTIYSASWDHSLRTWDVETGTDTAKIVLCADCWKGDSVVSGGSDNKLCISGNFHPMRRWKCS